MNQQLMRHQVADDNTMAIKLGFRHRERRLAFIAEGVIGTWILVSWLVQPLWDKAHDLKLHVEAQKEKLDSLTQLLLKAPVIDREYARISYYLHSVYP